jgi:hypothetical protein
VSIFFWGDFEVKMTFDEDMSEVPDKYWDQLGRYSFRRNPEQIQSRKFEYSVYNYIVHDDFNHNYTMDGFRVQRPEYEDVTLSLDDLASLKMEVVDDLTVFNKHYHLSDRQNYILYNYLYAKFCILRRRPSSLEVDF